ncbi:hypothetical protein MXD81_16040, partial [Microbacteriaceae bacterium K1510]|nr:hypothetical protein [Microbacteriaceae bacterium K1510]
VEQTLYKLMKGAKLTAMGHYRVQSHPGSEQISGSDIEIRSLPCDKALHKRGANLFCRVDPYGHISNQHFGDYGSAI